MKMQEKHSTKQWILSWSSAHLNDQKPHLSQWPAGLPIEGISYVKGLKFPFLS